jgi:[protein-PII] uridylyltransferase
MEEVMMNEPVSASERPKATGPGIQPALNWAWEKRRDWFRDRLRQQPPADISPEELEAHFSGMPAHYWRHVDEPDLLWGLGVIHGFLKLVTTPGSPATKPYMESRQVQPAGQTRVVLCTWDRLGLLAKAAAAFSELRLSILTAEAFTRSDDLVLDTFTVVDLDSGGAASQERLKEMLFLLEGALSEPPRFASVWMCSRHKYVRSARQAPARISFDNELSETSTLVQVEAADRLGLLYDILHTLAEEGLDVAEAHIATEHTVARDVLHVTDAVGNKVLAPERLKELGSKLSAALAPKAT